MFRKLLLCSDLSSASDTLTQCVNELKTVGVEQVVLTHVGQMSDSLLPGDSLHEKVTTGLEKQKKILEGNGLQVTIEMVEGPTAKTLNETADKHDVSAILIGSHGKGIIHSATLGSVSATLLHHARRPVLLARIALLDDNKCKLVCKEMFSDLLFPTDLLETAERALDYLIKISADTNCRVTFLHVIEETPATSAETKRVEESARFLLESKKSRLESHGVSDVNIEIVFGTPHEKIIERTRGGKVSLIIMGCKGRAPVEAVISGSVSNKVVRYAEAPVLLIPSPRP
jgi:nucleotide-binding universal stress UspA family protein